MGQKNLASTFPWRAPRENDATTFFEKVLEKKLNFFSKTWLWRYFLNLEDFANLTENSKLDTTTTLSSAIIRETKPIYLIAIFLWTVLLQWQIQHRLHKNDTNHSKPKHTDTYIQRKSTNKFTISEKFSFESVTQKFRSAMTKKRQHTLESVAWAQTLSAQCRAFPKLLSWFPIIKPR